jgi:predicted transposase
MTVCGEFFPEVYPAFRSGKWSRGEEDTLKTEMRLFCACMRWAFNRLLEGASRDEIKKLGQELFGLNSRYVDDARLRAQAVLDSQKELLELEIEETENKLHRARKKLGLVMRKLAELETHRENGTIPKVVFGGRKLWKKVCKGRATRKEWWAARKNRLYSRGDETKGGNPNIKVTYREGEFYLAVTISHLSEKVGEDALGRPKMSHAPG